MPSKGFIPLPRSIQDEWFWSDCRLAHAMVDLLIRANHKPASINYKGRKVEISRGEHITTIRELAETWGYKRSQTQRILKLLEQDKEVTIRKNEKGTFLKVVRYDELLSSNFIVNKGLKRDNDGTKESLNNNEKNDNKGLSLEEKSKAIERESIIHNQTNLKLEIMEKFLLSEHDYIKELEKFNLYNKANGKFYDDITAAFTLWIIRREEYSRTFNETDNESLF